MAAGVEGDQQRHRDRDRDGDEEDLGELRPCVWSTASVVAAAPWTAVTRGHREQELGLTSSAPRPAAGTTETRLTRPVRPIVGGGRRRSRRRRSAAGSCGSRDRERAVRASRKLPWPGRDGMLDRDPVADARRGDPSAARSAMTHARPGGRQPCRRRTSGARADASSPTVSSATSSRRRAAMSVDGSRSDGLASRRPSRPSRHRTHRLRAGGLGRGEVDGQALLARRPAPRCGWRRASCRRSP